MSDVIVGIVHMVNGIILSRQDLTPAFQSPEGQRALYRNGTSSVQGESIPVFHMGQN